MVRSSQFGRLKLERSPHGATVCCWILCLGIVPGHADAQPSTSSGIGDLKIGHVRLKPSGFFEAIGAVRSATTKDNVSTDFGAIPLSPTPSDGLVSVRHSRLALHGEMPVAGGLLTGYGEADLLSPSGRPPWRLRQAWGEYRRSGWRILGGHAWSLLRANQKGISSEKDLIDIDVIDPAYHVGLVGDRKRQIQVVREIGPRWLAAASYEEGGQIVAKGVHDRDRLHVEAIAFARRNGSWGLSAAAVIHAGKRVSFLTQQFASNGAGQEVVGGVRPGVRSYATIQGGEMRLPGGPIVFGYGGIVYGGRSSGNRVIGEWTIGAKQKLFTSPRIGAATLAAHYSHVERAAWSGGKGEMNYVMVSFRFTVPAPP